MEARVDISGNVTNWNIQGTECSENNSCWSVLSLLGELTILVNTSAKIILVWKRVLCYKSTMVIQNVVTKNKLEPSIDAKNGSKQSKKFFWLLLTVQHKPVENKISYTKTFILMISLKHKNPQALSFTEESMISPEVHRLIYCNSPVVTC